MSNNETRRRLSAARKDRDGWKERARLSREKAESLDEQLRAAEKRVKELEVDLATSQGDYEQENDAAERLARQVERMSDRLAARDAELERLRTAMREIGDESRALFTASASCAGYSGIAQKASAVLKPAAGEG